MNLSVRRRGLTLLVLLLAGLALAPSAGAASRNQILKDCEDDDKLSGTYTPSELRDARNNINSGLDTYSSCRDVLSAALQADARRRNRPATPAQGGGSGPSDTPSPNEAAARSLAISPGAAPPELSAEERRELRGVRERLPEVDVRGQRVVAGVSGVAGSSADARLPTSVLVVLIALGLATLLAFLPSLRRRVLDRRTA